jgi:hypothetical protein
VRWGASRGIARVDGEEASGDEAPEPGLVYWSLGAS